MNKVLMYKIIICGIIIFLASYIFLKAQTTPSRPVYLCNTVECRFKKSGGIFFKSERPIDTKPESSYEKSSTDAATPKSGEKSTGLDEGFELIDEKLWKFDCGEDNKNCKFKPTKVAEGTDMFTKKPSDIILDDKQPSGWKTCLQKNKVETLKMSRYFANKVKKNKTTGKWEGVDPKIVKPGEDGKANDILDCI